MEERWETTALPTGFVHQQHLKGRVEGGEAGKVWAAPDGWRGRYRTPPLGNPIPGTRSGDAGTYPTFPFTGIFVPVELMA